MWIVGKVARLDVFKARVICDKYDSMDVPQSRVCMHSVCRDWMINDSEVIKRTYWRKLVEVSWYPFGTSSIWSRKTNLNKATLFKTMHDSTITFSLATNAILLPSSRWHLLQNAITTTTGPPQVLPNVML